MNRHGGPGGMRVAITTLGCKVNQCESAALATAFTEKGASLVPFSGPADIYVINTCAVTGKAAAESRRLVRRALRANPDARVVVTGCYAQVASEELRSLGGRQPCIVGNACKERLADIALEQGGAAGVHLGDIGRQRRIARLPAAGLPGRTRAFLKIQDGCDRFCAYCIVPYARGPSRSLAPAEVAAQARRLIGSGYREIVLTGIHIGLYGLDCEPPADLAALLRRLLALGGEVRFRVSSLESAEISDELLDLFAGSPRIVPHLHLPLQSGDDRVLQRMNRPYTAAAYARVVERIAARLPDAAIGADVLAGFPGESEEEHEATCALLARLPLAYLHVFPYSRRPGTVAAAMAGQVPPRVKEERVARLRRLGDDLRRAFHARFLGRTRPVLVERWQQGEASGLTDNYIPVRFPAPPDVEGQVVRVRLVRHRDKGMGGELAAPWPGGQGTGRAEPDVKR